MDDAQSGKPRFYTPGWLAEEQAAGGQESSRGRLLIASCQSGDEMAGRVADRYNTHLDEAGNGRRVPHLPGIDYRFSDGETGARLEMDISGYDVFLFQSLYDPCSARNVDQNLMAFLVTVRAFRQWGANYVTAMLPYLAYARQDKPTKFEREPTTAKLVADLIAEAGISRLVTWHPHSSRLPGFFGSLPVDALEPIALFRDVFDRFKGRDDTIVVAPDAGASKLVIHFGRMLNIRSAVTSKYRPRPEEAEISDVMGDFRGRRVAVVLDDMIASGGTMEAVIKTLVEKKGIGEVHVGVSHNLCTESARRLLLDLHDHYGLREVTVTNSIPQTEEFRDLPFLRIVDIADVFSRAINSIHYNRSLREPYYGQAETRQ
jgi:ribose-phosphate pyrophosphokinase